ncbi:EamA-like transporter family protein [Leptospira weilii serovar Ranarum str. ICFT]|uniref:EamA-like transporter family protein n=1 Tax=Leptospira weilii serovar Ranarum str. ICFT TaxID=1218598 RepID=N1WA87_9LEPT|nr:DMT family transporter [Leptospira weilii]EMY77161.1 EamA-like transporter family protein [Leptospira weilii serovar Ranarum str. ICFT]
METSKWKPFWGISFVLAGAIFFSAKAIFVKLVYRYDVDPVTALTLRMLFAIPFFGWIAIRSGKTKTFVSLTKKDWGFIFILGFLGYYLASLFDFIGLEYISAGLERLTLFVYPTIVLIIGSILFKRKIKRAEVLAIFLTYSGIAVAFMGDVQAQGPNATKGVLFVFASAIAYSLYLVGSESLIPKLGSVRFTSYLMLLSGMIVVIHFFITRNPVSLIQPPNVYLYGLALGVLTTVIPAYFTAEGIRMIGSGRAAIVGSVGPMSTILLAWIFLGEPITSSGIAGTFLVLTGVLWIGKKPEPITESDS